MKPKKKATDRFAKAKASIAQEKRAMSRGGGSRVDWKLFDKRATRLLTPRQANSLAFHLMELDGACAIFRVKIRRLYRALAGATRNSAKSSDTAGDLWTELLHLRYHVRGALPSSEKLMYTDLSPESPKRTDAPTVTRRKPDSSRKLPKRSGAVSRKKTKKKVTHTSAHKKAKLAVKR